MVCIQWIHPQINECMSSLPPSQKTPVSHSVPPSSFYQNYIIQNGKAVARDSRSRIFVAVINLCELVVRSVGRFSRLERGATRVFMIYQICWDGKHINITVKLSNSPTQGQPNPRKNRLIVAAGPRLATANIFSWVGFDFR